MRSMKKSEIAHLATLSHLDIPDEKLEKFNQDFSGILAHIDSMTVVQEEVDTLPMYYHQSLREDEISSAEDRFGEDVRERIFAEFPKEEGHALLVKTVIKK